MVYSQTQAYLRTMENYHMVIVSHLLHCFSRAFCTTFFKMAPTWSTSFWLSTKQSCQGGLRPLGTTRERGEKGSLEK